MIRLVGCPRCRSYLRIEDPTCPHCGAAITIVHRQGLTAVAVLGLALSSGCGGSKEESSSGSSGSETDVASTTTIDEPDSGSAYGLPETVGEESGPVTTVDDTDESADSESSSGSSDTGGSDTGSSDTGSSDTSGDASTSSGESGDSGSGSTG